MPPIYMDLDPTLRGVGDREIVANKIPHLPLKDRGQPRFYVGVNRSELHRFLKQLTGYSSKKVIENIFEQDYEPTH